MTRHIDVRVRNATSSENYSSHETGTPCSRSARANSLDLLDLSRHRSQILTAILPHNHNILDPDTSHGNIPLKHPPVHQVARERAHTLHQQRRKVAARFDREDHVGLERSSDTQVLEEVRVPVRRCGNIEMFRAQKLERVVDV